MYRLSLLGIVIDYTIDYRRGTFLVESKAIDVAQVETRLRDYVRRYDVEDRARSVLEQATLLKTASQESPYDHVIQALSEFIYDVIEKSRRFALSNIITVMRDCDGDGVQLRDTLAFHLSNNVFSASISAMINAGNIEPSKWWAILGDVKNAALATRLVASCRRELESNPNHPGLHFLAGIGALYATDPDSAQIASSMHTGMENWKRLYGAGAEDVTSVVSELVQRSWRVNPTAFESVIAYLASDYRREDFAQAAYPYITTPTLKRICAASWIDSIAQKARAFRVSAMGSTRW